MANINIKQHSKQGGLARAAKLSPQERSTSAKIAAKARWKAYRKIKNHKCNNYCECSICGKPKFICKSKNLHPFSCKKLL